MTETGATLREMTNSILDMYFEMLMRHLDGAIRKAVGVWDSNARCGFKIMKMEESPREFSWTKGPRTKITQH